MGGSEAKAVFCSQGLPEAGCALAPGPSPRQPPALPSQPSQRTIHPPLPCTWPPTLSSPLGPQPRISIQPNTARNRTNPPTHPSTPHHTLPALQSVKEGSQLLTQAFQQDPENPYALVLLAHFCLQQGFYDKVCVWWGGVWDGGR